MNFIDRLVAAVAPQAAVRRARARLALQAYAAGRPRVGQKYWRAPSSGPNAEIEPTLDLLRARARQLVRDNPYAARAVSVLVAHQVGTGIMARIDNEEVQTAWDEWAKLCDHDGLHDLAGIMALAARTMAEGGESLIRIRQLSRSEARRRGLTVPLTLQVLEGDLLPLSVVGAPRNGNRIEQGVEFAPDGTRVAYHLRKRHPGENLGSNISLATELERVPADQIIHLYRCQRAGQIRGVPDFASVLLRLKQLDDYEDAALEQAKAQALLGVFITTPEPLDGETLVDGQDRGFELYPGMVHNLPSGTEPRFLTPSGSGGFEPFAMHQLLAIGAGLGVTYDQITGDLRQANYSSLRAGKIEFRRKVEQDQWMLFIPRMCEPVWSAFQRVMGVLVSVERAKVEWQPPRFEMIDPGKEIAAARDAVRAGFETWDQVVSGFGYDPDKQAAEIAKSNDRADALGLILDTDPRRISSAGQAQDAAQNAAVELGAADGVQPTPQERT